MSPYIYGKADCDYTHILIYNHTEIHSYTHAYKHGVYTWLCIYKHILYMCVCIFSPIDALRPLSSLQTPPLELRWSVILPLQPFYCEAVSVNQRMEDALNTNVKR